MFPTYYDDQEKFRDNAEKLIEEEFNRTRNKKQSY